jgi:uncharacterized protein with WD repeat
MHAGVAALSTADAGSAPAGAAAAGDADKRARNLQKKLRQIQQLKERAAGGAALEPEQQQKVAGEAALLEELRSLDENVV